MELEEFIDKFAIKPNMPFERVMVFIDGAYLRIRCKKFGGMTILDGQGCLGHLFACLIHTLQTLSTQT